MGVSASPDAAGAPIVIDDDDLGHIWCCVDDTIGLCGAHLEGPHLDDAAATCVVCTDLEQFAYDECPRLGRCVR